MANFKTEQRGQYRFAVLGRNPDAGKQGVSYSGSYLTVCITDGAEDAEMIAAALNAYPPAQAYAQEAPSRTKAAALA